MKINVAPLKLCPYGSSGKSVNEFNNIEQHSMTDGSKTDEE